MTNFHMPPILPPIPGAPNSMPIQAEQMKMKMTEDLSNNNISNSRSFSRSMNYVVITNPMQKQSFEKGQSVNSGSQSYCSSDFQSFARDTMKEQEEKVTIEQARRFVQQLRKRSIILLTSSSDLLTACSTHEKNMQSLFVNQRKLLRRVVEIRKLKDQRQNEGKEDISLSD